MYGLGKASGTTGAWVILTDGIFSRDFYLGKDRDNKGRSRLLVMVGSCGPGAQPAAPLLLGRRRTGHFWRYIFGFLLEFVYFGEFAFSGGGVAHGAVQTGEAVMGVGLGGV